MRHPMHALIGPDGPATAVWLRAWTVDADAGVEYLLFFVEGKLSPYRRTIETVSSIVDYEIEPVDDGSFNVYACERTRPEVSTWRSQFADRALVVVPPVRLLAGGTMRFTLVGDADDLQRLVENVSETVPITVDEVGTYDVPPGPLGGVLTDRQHDAVAIALDVGYYDVPRTGSLAAVADELDVSEGSASVLLRRAERAAFTTLLDRSSSSRSAIQRYGRNRAEEPR